MRRILPAIVAVAIIAASLGGATAQTNDPQAGDPNRQVPEVNCPAALNTDRNDTNLSDKLAQSRGVICPPTSIDPEIRKTPPAGGSIEVVPPPGSPGGNPNLQPK